MGKDKTKKVAEVVIEEKKVKGGANAVVGKTRPLPHLVVGTAGDALAAHNQKAFKGGKKAPSQELSKMRKSVKGSNKLLPRLERYLASLARPFDTEVVKCPVNYNPVPTFITTLARMTKTTQMLTVYDGTTTELDLFPGHASIVENQNPSGAPVLQTESAMDGVAYHAAPQWIGPSGGVPFGGLFCIGPIGSTDLTRTYPPAFGMSTDHLPIVGGVAASATSSVVPPAGGAIYPAIADTPLPYSASTGAAHARWKLVSMGVRIINVTQELNRGGSVITCQPVNPQNFPTIAEFSINPTWRDHGPCDKAIEVSWIPRAEDMAFWHQSIVTVPGSGSRYAATTPENAGLRIWFVNPTLQIQLFSVETVLNWELGGTLLQTVGTSAIHQPADKNVIEPTLSVLKNTAHTASAALSIAKSVAEGLGPHVSEAAMYAGHAKQVMETVGTLFGK
jgi:hypothetical protein